MKRLSDRKGFALLEVLVVMMIVLTLTSSLYSLAGMKQRNAIGKIQEDEAYYAAVSSVKLMAEEVINGTCEEGTASYVLASGDGIGEIKSNIIFQPDNGDPSGEIVIPVTLWSERSGDELLISAEAESGEKRKIVTIQLLKTEEQWIVKDIR